MSTLACPECNQTIRRDGFLVHFKKNHSTYFWDEMFRTTGNFELSSKLALKDMIEILSGESQPYYMGQSGDNNDIHLDFGTGEIFTKDTTAVKHIESGGDKHRNKMFELLKDTLTPEILIKIAKIAITKPERVIIDTVVIKSKDIEINNLKTQLEELTAKNNQMAQEIKAFNDEEKYAELVKANEQLTKQYNNIYLDNQHYRIKIDNLQREVNNLKEIEEQYYAKQRTSLDNDIEDLNLVAQTRKKFEKDIKKIEDDCEKKIKKIEETCEKKIKKMTEEKGDDTKKLEKDKKKLNKKIESLEDEIDALKYQLRKAKKQKTKDPDSDSESDSDSDNDSKKKTKKKKAKKEVESDSDSDSDDE